MSMPAIMHQHNCLQLSFYEMEYEDHALGYRNHHYHVNEYHKYIHNGVDQIQMVSIIELQTFNTLS